MAKRINAKKFKKEQLAQAIQDIVDFWIDEEGNFSDTGDLGINIPAFLVNNGIITEELHDEWVNEDLS